MQLKCLKSRACDYKSPCQSVEWSVCPSNSPRATGAAVFMALLRQQRWYSHYFIILNKVRKIVVRTNKSAFDWNWSYVPPGISQDRGKDSLCNWLKVCHPCPFLLSLFPKLLEGSKEANIERLQAMWWVRWEADQDDLVFDGSIDGFEVKMAINRWGEIRRKKYLASNDTSEWKII